MKKLFLTYLLSCLALGLFAQQGVWYSYDQVYYKIPTAKDGIYRISPATLQSAGINLSTTDPRNIRMFHRGKEVAIYIEGEQDGRLNEGDYIDFYGIRNDAKLDSILYRDVKPIPNPYFNTHTDTTAYFLTVANSPGKRMAVRGTPAATAPQIQY